MLMTLRTGLLLAGGTLLLTPDSASAQASDPADFSENLRPRYQVGGEETRWTLEERMAHHNVPGLALAIIEDGEIVHVAGYGVLQAGGSEPVNADTVFSVGSVSKVATAALALRMSANGDLDLARPVDSYLTSWSLPADEEFDNSRVTLRMILSHTAGFNLHGFGDFQPGADLPTTIETLNGEAPATHEALELLFEPGSAYKYSGGGYTLAQQVLEDVSGRGFVDLAEGELFAPLGMDRSSFANPLPEDHGNIARAHSSSGARAALPRGYEAMPEMAASGLWTSARDLGTLTASLIQSYRESDAYLPQSVAADMMTRVSPSEHGLGPRLDGTGEAFIFHHGGANNSYMAWIEGHLATGDGLVVLTNARSGNALNMEVRNAVADVMGWAVNAPVRVPELTLPADMLAGYAGIYSVDADFPLDQRQQMVRWVFDMDMEIRVRDGDLVIGVAGGERFDTLLPLAPNRFLVTGLPQRLGFAEIEIHRDADGVTQGLSLHIGDARSRYIRQ